MESDKLLLIEQQAKPPLVVPTALTIASILPAARNAVNLTNGQKAGPLLDQQPIAIEYVAAEQQAVRERILSLWWTRLVLALTAGEVGSTDKTAREVEEISRSEEHTSELQSLIRSPYARF